MSTPVSRTWLRFANAFSLFTIIRNTLPECITYLLSDLTVLKAHTYITVGDVHRKLSFVRVTAFICHKRSSVITRTGSRTPWGKPRSSLFHLSKPLTT